MKHTVKGGLSPISAHLHKLWSFVFSLYTVCQLLSEDRSLFREQLTGSKETLIKIEIIKRYHANGAKGKIIKEKMLQQKIYSIG